MGSKFAADLNVTLHGGTMSKYWSTLSLSWNSSPEEREISAHLADAEKRQIQRMGKCFGLWVAATLAIPFAFAVITSSSVIRGIAVVLMVMHLVTRQRWLGRMHTFLYSTAWAREHGYGSDSIQSSSR